MKIAVVNAFLCSSATAPENSFDDTKQGANSSELQVQSVVARVHFPHEGTRGLISNSRGIAAKALVVLLKATCKTTSLSCVPNYTE
jgi:hypothetical protein